LVVKHADGSIYTERLKEIGERTADIQERTSDIQDQLEDLSLRAELNEIDSEWEREREQYMVTDEHGRQHRPSSPAALIGLVVAIVGGVFMLVMVLNVTSEMSEMRSSMRPMFPPQTIEFEDGTTYEYDGGSLMRPSGSLVGSGDAFGAVSCVAPLIVVLMIAGAAAMLLHNLKKAVG
jgi:hypothetical protein